MADLIYAANMSLDGCTEDAHGAFDWAPPDDDVFEFITGLMRSAGTYLYGRRMYETMSPWETEPDLADTSPFARTFAEVWQAPDKVVYSSTLESAPTEHTRIQRSFDADEVRKLKETAGHDLLVGGPTLAAEAFRAGLVDQCHLLVWPVLLGGGKPALPADVRADLELVEQRKIGNGVVYLHHRVH